MNELEAVSLVEHDANYYGRLDDYELDIVNRLDGDY
jgi:hypothetical protein